MNETVDEVLLAEIVQIILRDLPETQVVYLYGSYARGEQRPDSDMDLAVLLPHETAKRIGSLAMSETHNAISNIARCDVDLINLRQVSTVFQNQIISMATLIQSINEQIRLKFEMEVLSSYMKLNEERSEILRSFRETKHAYLV